MVAVEITSLLLSAISVFCFSTFFESKLKNQTYVVNIQYRDHKLPSPNEFLVLPTERSSIWLITGESPLRLFVRRLRVQPGWIESSRTVVATVSGRIQITNKTWFFTGALCTFSSRTDFAMRPFTRLGQVWEHTPEQRVIASPLRRYSFGLR